MVDLLSIYRAQGLEIADNELPDYLPLYLEYASMLDDDAATAAINDVAPILAPVRDRLAKRQSLYAPVFDALLALAGAEIARGSGAGDPDEDDPAALDRAWEEAAVVFGPDAAPGKEQGCGRAEAILARMNAQ
jgi:nitrate reductase delta subunit